MVLSAGARLGPYEVHSALGAGGMGEVYRARDTRLKREVALKILPESFAHDADRLARFQREAEVLASLNHPNIAAIYGLEESNGTSALVMELVEGDTLADRIARGPIPIAEALPIARQIAEALEAAHEQGIIHRDLKPANVKLTADGVVKVLDFGLAKALERQAGLTEATASPTITSPAMMTGVGVLLGTAAYMAPEQARGRVVDKRADIWAFGCVLYEMLTAQRPFDGTEIQDVLARVLEREVDFSVLPSGTPDSVRRLLRRCFVKDRKHRLPDIAVARMELDDASAPPVNATAETGPTGKGWLRATVASLATAAIVATAGILYLPNRGGDEGVFRSSLLPPPGLLYPILQPGGFMALSPDGTRLVFAAFGDGTTRLWIRSLDGLGARPLEGTEGAIYPFWSPDGRSLAFFAGGTLRRIDAAGGPVVTVAPSAIATAGGAWNRDGSILFREARSNTIHRVPAAGGASTAVTQLDPTVGETAHSFPVFLSDGERFVFSASTGSTAPVASAETGGVFVSALSSPDRSRIMDEGVNVQFAAGYLFFVRGSALMAQPFDEDRLQLSGNPTQLADQVLTGGDQSGAFTVSQTGVIAYKSGAVLSQLTWFDRNGVPLGTVGDPAEIATLELSPDGTAAVVGIIDSETRARAVWLYDDLSRGVPTRLTFGDGDEASTVWSPDGEWIVFDSARRGSFDIYRKEIGGAAAEELLVGTVVHERPNDISADGRYVIYESGSTETPQRGWGDIWLLPLFEDRKPFPFLASPLNELRPKFSPDGTLVKYESTESGQMEMYVVRFPDGGGKLRVSQNGGTWGRWSQDGSELYYMSPDYTLMAVSITRRGGGIQVGVPRALFRTPAKRQFFPYDVSADGQRFLINALRDDPGAAPITLLVNWPALLQQ